MSEGLTFAEAVRSPMFNFAAIAFISFVMVSTFTQQLQVFLVSTGINIVQVDAKMTYTGLAIIFSTSSPIDYIRFNWKKNFTAIWGMLTVAANIGLAIGNPILGLLYDLTGTYQLTITVCIALMIICLIFFSINTRQITHLT